MSDIKSQQNLGTGGKVMTIIVMYFLFGMISFVTGFQNPFGVILKAQLQLSAFESQLGAAANFIAYAIIGIPAGMLLQRKGYKFSAISAVLVGFLGVVIMFVSSTFTNPTAIFTIYLIGALVAGFSMCMLNTVVNPMLNTIGGGGKKGNQLIQFGGSINSLAATICPIFVGLLIGNNVADARLEVARPALYVAGGIFLFAFIVLYLSKIPEPTLEDAKNQSAGDKASQPTLAGALKFRHFVLGAIGIFLYLGLEIGVPQIANIYMTTPTYEKAMQDVASYEQANMAPSAAIALSLPQVADEEAMSAMSSPDVAGMEMSAGEAAAPVITTEVSEADYHMAKSIVQGEIKPGLGISAAVAGALVGMYWFAMLLGRLFGGVVGGKISSRTMLSVVATVAIVFIVLAIYMPVSTTISVPGFDSSTMSFALYEVPIGLLFLVLCGLCTSVMWGGIFNLAVEGLGKFTAVASGFFMVMVCGGGIILPIQAAIADVCGYMQSYWVLVVCAAYLLFYAVAGSKPKKK